MYNNNIMYVRIAFVLYNVRKKVAKKSRHFEHCNKKDERGKNICMYTVCRMYIKYKKN